MPTTPQRWPQANSSINVGVPDATAAGCKVNPCGNSTINMRGGARPHTIRAATLGRTQTKICSTWYAMDASLRPLLPRHRTCRPTAIPWPINRSSKRSPSSRRPGPSVCGFPRRYSTPITRGCQRTPQKWNGRCRPPARFQLNAGGRRPNEQLLDIETVGQHGAAFERHERYGVIFARLASFSCALHDEVCGGAANLGTSDVIRQPVGVVFESLERRVSGDGAIAQEASHPAIVIVS